MLNKERYQTIRCKNAKVNLLTNLIIEKILIKRLRIEYKNELLLISTILKNKLTNIDFEEVWSNKKESRNNKVCKLNWIDSLIL